jgi:type I restriction enzyme S subunit
VIASDSGRKPLDTEKLSVRPPLPHEWKSRALNEVCTFSNGLWKGEKPPFIKVGVIRNTNFTTDGHLDDSDIAYLDVEAKKLDKRRLQHGDIILEKSGGGPRQPVGRVALFDKSEGDFSFSNFTAALRVIDPTELDFRFLHKFLHWIYVSGVTQGMQSNSTGIRNLDGDAYKAIRISFPALSEQRRITGILDEAFEGLERANANVVLNLKNAAELLQGSIEQSLTMTDRTWASKRLSEICDIKHGFAFKGEFFAESGDHVVLTPGNFYETGGYRDRGDKQKYYRGDIPRSYVLSKGDLLVAMTEQAMGLLGSAVLIPDSDRFLHNQRLGLVTRKSGVPWTNAFFYHVFNTRSVRRSIQRSASGTKVRHTSPTKIGEVVVSFPRSVVRQREIASALEEVAEKSRLLATHYQRKLDELESLKRALLHNAFSGAL